MERPKRRREEEARDLRTRSTEEQTPEEEEEEGFGTFFICISSDLRDSFETARGTVPQTSKLALRRERVSWH